MAKLNITNVSQTIQKRVATDALANNSGTTVLTLVNTGARRYNIGEYVAAWRKDTYPTPAQDPNTRIGVVVARTNTSVTVDWRQFGTTASNLAGRPTLAQVVMARTQITNELQRENSDATSVVVSANKTVTADVDAGVEQVVTLDGAQLTLPTPSAGLPLIFVNGGDTDGAVGFTLVVPAGVSVLGLGSAATAGKNVINTKASARMGDRIELRGGSSTVYYAIAIGNFDRQA